MAAQAKTVHALKPADVIADSPSGSPLHQHLRQDLESNRRRLSVSEKLAEGRGFWRGVFVGVSFGAAAGVSSSVAMMNIWVPQVMNVAQQAWVASSVFADTRAQDGALSVTPTGAPLATATAELAAATPPKAGR